MRTLLLTAAMLAIAGCGGDFGDSTIPPGTYGATFAELSPNRWTAPAPPNYRGRTLYIEVQIGNDGFPVVGGASVSSGDSIRVTLGDWEMTQRIQQTTGAQSRVQIAYEGTIEDANGTSVMSGGYILDWSESLQTLHYDEGIYVGTSIPDETRASRIIRFEGELRE